MPNQAIKQKTIEKNNGSTKQRIIETAELLFAENGFAQTSLRTITNQANVNLASIHYHFQSKEKLIQILLQEKLDVLNQQRIKQLDNIEKNINSQQDYAINLRPILSAFIVPAIKISHDQTNSSFVKMLARAYIENSAELRNFLSSHYGFVTKRFSSAIAKAMPKLSSDELYWRFDFIIGSMTYLMADFGGIKKMDAINNKKQLDNIIDYFIQFAINGLIAPSKATNNQSQRLINFPKQEE